MNGIGPVSASGTVDSSRLVPLVPAALASHPGAAQAALADIGSLLLDRALEGHSWQLLPEVLQPRLCHLPWH